ncbi:MAG: nucleotide exchange factor GrpE [Clostridiales bacterium]|nr:nucleotide exchange factor GrpE [Clostridia bacterium]MCR4563020.1 nucleotide exchange factor GrpE [Clostridiales bacterium]
MKKEKENTAPVENEQTAEENEEITEIEKIKKELEEKADRLLRTLAEYDNFRKRSIKEKEQAYSDTKADILSSFLPVIDNVERAMNNDNASYEDYKKGAEMIFAQFLKVISDSGVTAYGEKGDAFDPLLHNAVMHIEDENYGENEIVEVFEKGYKLGDRVLRPATVQVAN